MHSADNAGVFSHIAALVCVMGESFFKVRACLRAAETIAGRRELARAV